MTIRTRRSPSGPVAPASTLIFGAYSTNPLGTSPGYVPLLAIPAGLAAQGIENTATIFLPNPGLLTFLCVNVLGVPSATTAMFSARLNGVNTALTVTLAAGQTFAEIDDIIAVPANARFAIQTVLGAAVAGPTDVRVSVTYE